MNTMFNPSHPGEILREDVIVPLGLSVTEAAALLGVTRVSLSRILNGHTGISPDFAIRLEMAGAGTADTWLAVQTQYDLAQARAHTHPHVGQFTQAA